MTRIILASASPRRFELLKSIGLTPHDVIPADIDESVKKAETPRAYVKRLAVEKANAVAVKHPNDIIIAADSTVAVGRRILGKPESADEARAFFRLMSGRSHNVITGVCVAKGGLQKSVVAVTKVKFKRLTEREIELLVECNEWHDKCGGYTISGQAGAFIVGIVGSHHNVLGLPVYDTYKLVQGALKA